ncbi:MAG: GGDEF domain-containing protein [Burkholderiales bacterium]|nr:GGDEF domain-containing protein [Burkholderiales bacterium]
MAAIKKTVSTASSRPVPLAVLYLISVVGFGALLYAFAAFMLPIFLVMVLGWLWISYVFVLFHKNSTTLNETQRLVHVDTLTGLPNRRGFDYLYSALVKRAKRQKTPISVLFIDIDHFKQFNDKYGHATGDIALRYTARALSRCLRRPLDLCCRWGGEEFAVVLPDTNSVGACYLAENLLYAVKRLRIRRPGGIALHITISIGIATSDEGPIISAQDLLTQADLALYKAKDAGRDRYFLYEGIGQKKETNTARMLVQ